jgi:tryptophan halogenase
MSNIENIVVIGAGTTGYLTVFHLCETYPNKKITWIYPEENQPIGVGEAIIPDVSKFLNNFGITHKDILKNCNGTLKFGIYLKGWNTPGEDFTFPFGYESVNIKHNSASQDRIMKTHKIPKGIFEYQNISTHFRATELLMYMDKVKEKYLNLKVVRKEVTLNEIKDSYDLVIDCTGFERKISYLPDNFKNINDKIPNNQVFLFRHNYTDREKQCVPYTVAEAMNYGWCFNIPLRNELACGYVHDNKFDVTDEYIQYLEKKFNIKVQPEQLKKLKMITGRNKVHLKDNVVAMGLSSCFIEPLESTGLYLVTSSLRKLCDYIDEKITENEYNFFINEEFDTITDFIVEHYKFSKRSNDYWNFYKSVKTKKRTINIFPNSGWDTIRSGFLPEVKRPTESLDGKELIEIHRGKPFHEWILEEENYI